MKKILIGLCFLFACIGGIAAEFTVPPLTGRVVDTSNTLSKKDIEYLENLIKIFEKNTKGQFAVCIVPTLEGESIEQASIKIAEKWKIGYKGKDNGILFLLAMQEREFRLEIGYGYEGKLNDGKCGEICRTLVIPAFKDKQWAKGIGLAIQKCDYLISGNQTEELKEAENTGKVGFIIFCILILLILILVGLSVIFGDDSDCVSTYSTRSSYSGGGFGGGFRGGGGGFGGGGFSGKF